MRKGNFFDAISLFLGNTNTSGEISLAGYLAEHGFVDRNISMGSVGSISLAEALAFNALVSRESTFVVLGYGSLAGGRNYSAELISEIEAHGFDVRTQFADLTIPGRWPQLLTAMASTNVGILGIDAHLASAQAGFWSTLQQFMKDGKSVVFIRNMLDFRNVKSLLPFIRSMPEHWERNVIATTPNSVWLASDVKSAGDIRKILRQSGLFPEDAKNPDADLADTPIVVRTERALQMVDSVGRFPRSAYLTNSDYTTHVDYKSGWSRPEPDGCWTADYDAVIKLRLPPTTRTPVAITVSGNSWLAPDKKEQILEIGLGNEPTQWVEAVFHDSEEVLTTTLECDKMKFDSSDLVIRFQVTSPGRPSDHGGEDTRLLGFKCRSISVFT
jgi:hypothetical protein